jgi:N-acetyl sugar amidotransferase|tara:strand:- start:30 stop:1157 length:1128 start_codon:yes stop_codon:yes gene_type:complete
MKICKKCIQPDTRPGIYFNEEGVCGACLWEEKKKSINWNSRFDELVQIANWAKENSSGNYDCVIGVSGGKDSTTQALTARDRLGLKALLVNSEPEGITEIGKANIENLKNLGFDVISLRPNPKIMKKLVRSDFYKNLNPVKITEFSLWASTYIIAEKFQIPLIIQGENPGLTLGASLTGVGTDDNALKADELNTLASGWEGYLEVEGITKQDLFFFHYDRKKLESMKVKGIWLQYYLKEWSFRGNAEFAIRNGMQCRPNNFDWESIGTYMPFAQLDSDLVQVNQMLKYIKFGFGQCIDNTCYDLRDGIINRKEALELVKKYDGKCAEQYIKKFCNYIEISIDEFWRVANSFRGPMWTKKENEKWDNDYWKILENE